MRWLIPLLLSGCANSCTTEPVDTSLLDDSAEPVPAEDVRVIVLVIDGVRVDESLGDGYYSDTLDAPSDDQYPAIRSKLMPIGATMDGAIAAGMTRTAPGHADLITGRRTAFANYPNDTKTPGAYLPELPTLIDAIAPAPALVVTNAPLVSPIYRSISSQGGVAADLVEVTDDIGVLTNIKREIAGSDYRLVVANLHQADAFAHGGSKDRYNKKAQAYDDLILGFWNWLQEQEGWKDRTVLTVVADHGRHRIGTEDGWSDHGDHCVGCRQIPMLMVGPGIRQGVRVEETVTLEDLGVTLAGLLGVDLPYGTGAPIAEALTVAPAPAVEGTLRFAVDDGVLITEDTADGQATVSLDGEQVSAADAFSAEAPGVAVSGDDVYACWRELDLTDPDPEGTWPWQARCLANGAAIDPDISPVFPEWQPAMAADKGGLWMGWVDNLTGVATLQNRIYLSRWTDGGGWDHSIAVPTDAFPTDVTIQPTESTTLLAFAESTTGASGRLGRRITLYGMRESGSLLLLRVRPDEKELERDLIAEGDRLERPALWADGETISLAWVAFHASSSDVSASLWRIDSTDAGNSWQSPIQVSDDILGHVTPAWTDSGELLWVTPDGQACGEARGCASLSAELVMALGADGDDWLTSVRVDGTWTLETPAP